MRIIFATPPTKNPTGGIANYFALAKLANELGHDAVIATETGLDTWWMQPDLSQETVQLSQAEIGPDAVVITPEWWYTYRERVGQGKIVPYVQNHTYTLRFSGGPVWALSDYIAKDVQERLNTKTTVVERVLTEFWCQETHDYGDYERQGVLIVPTKNAWDYVKQVKAELEASNVHVTIVDHPIGAYELRYLYQAHRYYMALSHPEGLDMMGQEAMACGCCVVGFEGAGRTDYLSSKTGVVVADGNWMDLVDAVLTLEADEKKRLGLAESGQAYVCKRYAPDKVKKQLSAAINALGVLWQTSK